MKEFCNYFLRPRKDLRNVIVSGNARQWLTTISNEADYTELSLNQFRDTLTLRYSLMLKVSHKNVMDMKVK